MRLICPNCGAQYEVADDVIPQAGRDVQCSNCGHTWFEHPGKSVADELGRPAEEGTAPEQQAAPETAPEPTPEPETAPDPEPAPAQEPTPEPEDEPVRRELSPDVADILREEAEFEQAAREAEQSPLETQPDLDLSHDPEEDRRSKEARDRLSRLRGEADVGAAVSATMAEDANAPRRELLPDIEEINSSLRPDAAPTEADYIEDAPRKRSGFRRGFMFMVLLALIALLVYIFAPQISAAVPQLEPALTSYVNWVDGLRLWLDAKIQGFVDSADGGVAGDAAPEATDVAPADITTDAPDVPAEPEAAPEG